ncbi:MAG TPA: TonB-dependent receptor, partial [Luteitalea sp.]|nr:TonB-dependent receptor [Luteitalea sp.]
NSTLGIYNPIEEHVGGLAALMPTIDINTQRNSGGIGNAWDFYDDQRVFNASGRWSLLAGAHSLQAGLEYRRINLEGEYMSRTNGDLDYDNWVLFFTGHGAAGGGSDLDQGDTRRDFLAGDYGVFLQDDWRLGKGLTLNLGLRYDVFGNLTERNGMIGNYYLPSAAARMGAQPGFNVPANSPFFNEGFTPLDIGLFVEPGTPVDLSQIHVAPNDSTLRTDWNNVAPRLGLAWQPSFAQKVVFRGGWGMYYERPAASHKVDLQRAAPFFIYQNVPAPANMADPYPRLNVNPFEIPLNVTIVRDATGAPAWRREDGTLFPATSPFSSKNNTFVDPLIRTPYTHQWSASMQYEPVKQVLVDLRYVGSRGVDLLGKVNLAVPVDPRVTPVNGFTDIRDSQGRLINPDFFVPQEFLGLNRNGGFQQLTNIGYSNYHALQANLRGRLGRTAAFNVAYTFSKSMDVLSSDRSLLEHDPTRPDNNYGPADFDRPHRLTTTWTTSVPGIGRDGSLVRALTGGWQVSGMFTYQSGTPFTVLGAATTNAYFAQVSRVRVSYAPGGSAEAATRSGPVQGRLDNYFDVAQFQDSGDAWGDTGRNILRGPSQVQLDLTLSRMFRVFQGPRLELRWEVFNALNTPVFANPNSTFAANGFGNAGRITSTIGGPRTMQVAARMTF